jgi:hypothetical protein
VVADAIALLRERMPQFADVPIVTNVNGAAVIPGKQLGK